MFHIPDAIYCTQWEYMLSHFKFKIKTKKISYTYY